jgi:hypothetical protein
MATDQRCVVRVGSHPGPFWRDLTRPDGWQVCSRHRSQFEERDDEFGPFEWVPAPTKETQR